MLGVVLAYAGLCHFSDFRGLRHLSLYESFYRCTHEGLKAALATMTGIVTACVFVHISIVGKAALMEH
jgi:hypothetical protein